MRLFMLGYKGATYLLTSNEENVYDFEANDYFNFTA